MRLSVIALLLSISGLLVQSGTASAQDRNYPTKPIMLVTPFAPGGGADLLARVLAEALRKQLGQPVLVRNIDGAGGVLGARYVANANADGYTLLSHNLGMALAPTLYKDLEYDPIKSFAPIGLWADTPLILIGDKKLPVGNIKELVDYAKRNKDKITFASSGMGSATHLCGMQFEKVIGSNVTMVQYKGAGPALQDVLGGRVDLLCSGAAGNLTSHIRAGDLKGFLLTGGKRLDSLPNLPTPAEVGLPDLTLTSWYGLYAPAKTPSAVIARLAAALQAIVQDPAVKAQVTKMETVLLDPKQATPAALNQMLSSQIDLWRPLIQKSLGTPN